MGVEKFYNSVKFSLWIFSQDNELLVCCIANLIYVYKLTVANIHSSRQILWGHLGKIEFCTFLKVNLFLISYGVDGMVFLWNITESKAIGFMRIVYGREKIVSMAVSPEEDRAVCFLSSGRVCVITLGKLECFVLEIADGIDGRQIRCTWNRNTAGKAHAFNFQYSNLVSRRLQVRYFVEFWLGRRFLHTGRLFLWFWRVWLIKCFHLNIFLGGGASGTPALVVSRIMPVVPYRHHWLQFAHYHTNLPIEGDFFLFSDNVSAIRYLLFSHVTAAIIVFQKNETAAMLVSQSNLVGVEVFPCVITFFWSTKFA